ncbi:MAG TPA: acyl-CoA dehydratase activase, partial [Gemmatimonadales bacterium]|nr:acyl-CoA dehydratase activase [Gemmatimonadales bacterium]
MTLTCGVDVGSTYTKVVLLRDDGVVAASAMVPTGFRLEAAADQALQQACHHAGVARGDVEYVVATGHGRYQVSFRDTQATDLTAQGRGVHHLFPAARTVLDVGGQTMKASRLDERGRVTSFRLNDKCAAGTGAFLEKSARYLGYGIEQIGPLAESSHEAATISGVCAVFAESEVINHVSSGVPPGDILHGSMVSLVQRSVQLLKRVRIEPDVALVGGIMRFPTMVRVLR